MQWRIRQHDAEIWIPRRDWRAIAGWGVTDRSNSAAAEHRRFRRKEQPLLGPETSQSRELPAMETSMRTVFLPGVSAHADDRLRFVTRIDNQLKSTDTFHRYDFSGANSLGSN